MLERSCRRMKDDSWKGFQVRKKRETITDGARRFGTQWTETGRSSCAAEGRVSIVYAGGWDHELGGLRRIGRSERATRIPAQHDRIAPMETPEVVLYTASGHGRRE